MGSVCPKPKVINNRDSAGTSNAHNSIAIDRHIVDKPQRQTKRKKVACKILILGEPNVGKTSLVNRFCEGVSFCEAESALRLVHEKKREIDVKMGLNEQYNMNMNIYDCAGDN